MLFTYRIQNIPVLVVAPGEAHDAAKKVLGEATYKAVVAPENLFDEIRKVIG